MTDTAWTPGPDERRDVFRGYVPLIALVVERIDLFAEAMERLDRWADGVDVIARTTIDGVSWWHGIREPIWHWIHERMLWAYVVDMLVRSDGTAAFACEPTEAALIDVLGARGIADSDWLPQVASADPDRTGSGGRTRSTAPLDLVSSRLLAFGRRAGRRLARRRRSGEDAGSLRTLDDRVRAAAAHDGRGILVLSYTRVAQTIGAGDGARQVDPHLGSVVARLRDAGLIPIVLALGLDRTNPADRALVASDAALLPGWLLTTRWAHHGTMAASDPPRAGHVEDRLEAMATPSLEVAGTDLGPRLMAEVRRSTLVAATSHVRLIGRIDRLLAEIRPAAVLMTHEGLRTTWLVAAARRGVSTFAVQHGIIYATHPGYRHRRAPGLILPTCTFVYGPFERRTLLESGGYLPDEVEVTGSPRLDQDQAVIDGGGMDAASAARERLGVRSELGVAALDRLLVVSTLFDGPFRWSHFTNMLERLLGGPLPGVHVVFKLHPGEVDQGPYRRLLGGLAAAGGYDAPPISVIKEIDLCRLLRAADAHLGMSSTVLTDAVVVGTPNLIATNDAHADMLGYIQAGVARPVSAVKELLAALDEPCLPDPDARRAFLEDHFRSGNASRRIAEIHPSDRVLEMTGVSRRDRWADAGSCRAHLAAEGSLIDAGPVDTLRSAVQPSAGLTTVRA